MVVLLLRHDSAEHFVPQLTQDLIQRVSQHQGQDKISPTVEQVRRDTGLSVTDAQVERVLAGKSCSMDEDARNIIQKQGRLYTERLLSAAMESGFDLKAIPVVMLGGGASVVKGNVSEQDSLCRVFALIDDKVNAEGFERILGQFSGGGGKA